MKCHSSLKLICAPERTPIKIESSQSLTENFQKKSTLRNSMLALILAGAFATHQASASCDDIDTMQEFIKTHLQNVSPEVIVGYEKYEHLFQDLLEQFLSRDDHRSIATFVPLFDKVLLDFNQNIVNHPLYANVQKATHRIHDRFSKLVNVLRGYIGKRDAYLSLIAAISSYIDLVPKKVRSRYNFGSLAGAMRHRLSSRS